MADERRSFGLFQNAPQAILVPAATEVFREGDEGACMYAVKRGSVTVLCDGKEVDRLGPGEVFGEMALLDQPRRSGTVRTTEETELVEIDRTQFAILARQNPHFALEMMRLLAERLRRADALYRSSDR